MQQEPIILFVDLVQEAEAFRGTLQSMGLSVKSVSLEEAPLAIDQMAPRALLAPAKQIPELLLLLKNANTPIEVPFFALEADAPTSHRHASAPRGVAGLMPRNVDAGVLSLRLQTAMQRAQVRKVSQPTLVGMGASEKTSQAPSPPGVSTQPASAPVLSVPSAPVVSSAAPSAALHAAPLDAAPLDAAPLDAAPLDAQAPALASPSIPEAVSSESPVTTNAPPEAVATAALPDFAAAQAASKKKLMRVGAAVGAALVLGAAMLMLGGGDEAAPGAEKEASAEKTAAQAEGVTATKAEEAAPKQDVLPTEAEKAEKTDGDGKGDEPDKDASSDPDAAAFKIVNPGKAKSCDDVLDKPESHYKKQASWRGSQAWKLARRSLMRGKEEQAHKRMCESAFIEPKGPATMGLARHYLARRDLKEALEWANRAVKASSGTKRAAKELLGDVYCQMGKMKEARALWLETFKLDADQKDRLAAVGRRFIKSAAKARRGGDAPLAERLLRRAAAFNPDDADAAAALASILMKNDEDKLAKHWAEHALSIDKKSKVAGYVMSKLGK